MATTARRMALPGRASRISQAQGYRRATVPRTEMGWAMRRVVLSSEGHWLYSRSPAICSRSRWLLSIRSSKVILTRESGRMCAQPVGASAPPARRTCSASSCLRRRWKTAVARLPGATMTCGSRRYLRPPARTHCCMRGRKIFTSTLCSAERPGRI